MTAHDLKTWPEPFAAILDGSKRHEVRKNDRAFAVGDVLHLREWDPSYYDCDEDGPRLGRYTGRMLDVRVTHLTPGGAWGLPADLCVMSVEPMRAPTPAAQLDLEAAMWIVPGHAGDREWQVTGPDAEQRAKAVAAVTGTKPYPLYRINTPALIAEVKQLRAWQDSAIKNGVSSTEQHEALRDAMGGDVRAGASRQMEAARILAERRDRIAALVTSLAAKDARIAALETAIRTAASRIRPRDPDYADRLRALAKRTTKPLAVGDRVRVTLGGVVKEIDKTGRWLTVESASIRGGEAPFIAASVARTGEG